MPANPLTASDREQIRAGIERGDSDACIARGLGRHRSTIGREIACNGGRAAYTATKAQVRADKARLRPKAPMLVAEPELAWQVTKRLVAGDSPMTIFGLIERNIALRKLSSILTALSVAIGVMLVCAILKVRDELSSTYRR